MKNKTMITRENYEVYFLDHSEGNLSPEEQSELFSFLEQNPYLENELQLFENTPLPEEHIEFIQKDKLKKVEIQATLLINESNYNDFFIAWYEGDLDVTGKEEVKQFLKKNPSLIFDFELFAKARLQPEKVIFTKKYALKKHKTIGLYRSIAWVTLAAASLTTAFFLFKGSPKQANQAVTPIVIAESKPIQPLKPIEKQISTPKTIQIAIVEKESPKQQVARIPETINSMPIISAKEIAYTSNFNKDATPIKLNTELFENILLRYSLEELQEQKKSSFINKTIRLMASISPFRSDRKQDEKKPITFWDIADYGVKGINELTASSIEFKHSRNQEGKLESFYFGNDNFKIAKAAPGQ